MCSFGAWGIAALEVKALRGLLRLDCGSASGKGWVDKFIARDRTVVS